eukprot:snap_masked-scaffold_18-processed-gene-6.21-mRNA-1 protein AED:1.00 eAED:1.00 QI:0/-1/0/0/-1/1/1/0/918
MVEEKTSFYSPKKPLKRSANFIDGPSSPVEPFRSFFSPNEEHQHKYKSFDTILQPQFDKAKNLRHCSSTSRLPALSKVRRQMNQLLPNLFVSPAKYTVWKKPQKICRTDCRTASILQKLSTLEGSLLQYVGSFLETENLLKLALCSRKLYFSLETSLLDIEHKTISSSDLLILSRYWRPSTLTLQNPFRIYGNLTFLRKLTIKGTIPNLDFEFLNNSFSIETLIFKDGILKINNLIVLKNKTKLINLAVTKCMDVQDACFIPETRSLNTLNLSGCVNLKNLSNLRCTNLTNLSLSGCTALTDIQSFSSLENLESLNLSYCSFLTDISVLSQLKLLRELDVSGLDRVDDFSSIKELKLDLFQAELCSPGPLFQLSKLLLVKHIVNEEIIRKSIFACISHEGWMYEASLESIFYILSIFLSSSPYNKTLTLVLVKTLFTCLVSFAQWETTHKTFNGIIEPSLLLQERVSSTGYSFGFSKLLERTLLFAKDIKLLKLIVKVFSRIAHHKPSIPPLSEYTNMFNFIIQGLQAKGSEATKTREISASCVLLIALDPLIRQRILTSGVLKFIVDNIFEDSCSNSFAIEGAGAIWNLAASLEIGKSMLEVEPRLILCLMHIVKHQDLQAKVQAVGALRNLCILNENKQYILQQNSLEKLNVISLLVSEIKTINLPEEEDLQDSTLVSLLNRCLATLRILCCEEKAQLQLLREISAGGDFLESLNAILNFGDSELITQTTGLLLALSFNKLLRHVLGDVHIIQSLVFLIGNETNEGILISCCGCLWNLAMNDYCECVIVSCNAFPKLLDCLFHENENVILKALGAIKNLSYIPSNKRALMNSDGLDFIVRVLGLRKQYKNKRIITYALGTIRLLSLGDSYVKEKLDQVRIAPFLSSCLKRKDTSLLHDEKSRELVHSILVNLDYHT